MDDLELSRAHFLFNQGAEKSIACRQKERFEISLQEALFEYIYLCLNSK